MKPSGNSPIWPWTGACLALVFIGTSAWLSLSFLDRREEFVQRVGLVDALMELQRPLRALHQGVDPRAWADRGATPEEMIAEPARRFHEALSAMDRERAPVLEVSPTLDEVLESVELLPDLQADFLHAAASEEDIHTFIHRYHVEVDHALGLLDSGIGRQRQALRTLVHDLGRRWNVLQMLLVFTCVLAILTTWLLARQQRQHRELGRAQAALEEAQRRLGMVVSTSPIVLWAIDRDGTITLSEGKGLESLGRRPGEVVGRSVYDVYAEHPAILEMVRRCLGGEVLTESVEVGEVRFQASYFPMADEAGRVTGAMGVATDISELTRTQEALRRTEEIAQEAQKVEAVGRLAGGIAHEFSNLLTVISGFASLIHDSLRPESRGSRDADQILRASDRATELTQQLLTFSRRHRSEPRLIDLNVLVGDTAKMLRRLLGEDVELVILPARTPDRVHVDPGQFEQVIVNMALNARDAMPKGGRITLDVGAAMVVEGSVRPDLAPGEYVTLAISDDGLGMGEEVRKRIFEPFFTTKEPGKGTGLGLPTCYGIVRQLGGEITVETRAGAGTTFVIYLPRADGVPEEDVLVPRAASPPPRGSETVLLVEDERTVRAFAARVLRDQGYFVLEADDGEKALDVNDSYHGRIDLLVTDVAMPRMGGYELADELTSRRSDIRVLFISGYAEERPRRGPAASPDCDYLQKPFGPAELADRVRTCLDGAPVRVG